MFGVDSERGRVAASPGCRFDLRNGVLPVVSSVNQGLVEKRTWLLRVSVRRNLSVIEREDLIHVRRTATGDKWRITHQLKCAFEVGNFSPSLL
jgi:hypothetical protein